MVKCENCGAIFDAHEDSCPYCGSINYSGAEEKYMQGMQDIKSGLADIDDEASQESAKMAKKNIKLVLIVLLIVFLLAIIGIIAVKVFMFVNTYKGTYTYEADPKKEAQWMEEYGRKLDALYEAGDIDGLIEFYEERLINKDMGAFFNWDHSYLVVQASTLKMYMDMLNSGETLDDFDIRQIMFNALYYYNGDYKGCDLTKKDLAMLEEYSEEYLEAVYSGLHISADTLEEMKKYCVSESGYVLALETSDYVDEHMDMFK